MSEANNADKVRASALDRIERSERQYKTAFFGAVGVELLFLPAFLLLADFSDRTHVLLLLATVATYTILVLGLLALGSHVNRNTLRTLKAIEMLESQLTRAGR